MADSGIRIKTDLRNAYQEKIYIACDDIDFAWSVTAVDSVASMWAEGLPIDEIAKQTDRDIDGVFILLFSLARKGRVQWRQGSVYGKMMSNICA